MNWLKEVFTPIPRNRNDILLVIAIAVTYIVAARISQIFALPPGNITPVWIPSGIMMALALWLGARIWLGVFLGAFIGNAWAYFSTDSLQSVVFALLSGTANGIGDVLSTVLMALLLKEILNKKTPFDSIPDFLVFLCIGVVVGPLISAMFGVTGLLTFQFIDSTAYVISLINWWVGDGVGVLLFTPFLITLFERQVMKTKYLLLTVLFSGPVALLLTASIFELIAVTPLTIKALVILVPLAFMILLSAGQKAVYSVQIIIVGLAIFATYNGLGPFAKYDIMSPLVSLQLFIAAFSTIVFSVALLVYQRQSFSKQLSEKQAELEKLYRKDALTNLWNRYRLEEYLDLDLKRFQRSQVPFSLYILDIDDFKKVNDTYGHLEGDRILKELSALLQQQTRSGDLLARWGGEEFVIVASENTPTHSGLLADKLVNSVGLHDFSLPQKITVSVGYTIVTKGDDQLSLLKRADDALYKAKHAGKNQSQFT